jgi:hypothetical protein
MRGCKVWGGESVSLQMDGLHDTIAEPLVTLEPVVELPVDVLRQLDTFSDILHHTHELLSV